MFALISPEKTQLPPGSVVRLPAAWQEYQILSPLPKHGRDANLIADIIKTLLDYTGCEYDAFTPVTMELPQQSGIEPDYCFYIDNWQAVSGKERINWSIEPPPDLVLEIDVTSYSDVNDYLPYRVPEVWLFRKQLCIYHLQGTEYLLQAQSNYFPEINLQDAIARCLQVAYERNTSAAIREFRQRLGKNSPNSEIL